MAGGRIDGRLIAKSVRDEVRKAASLLGGRGVTPRLATILVGDDPASATYVRNKHAACREVGIEADDHRLPASTAQEDLARLVDSLNANDGIHGILVQLPLPDHIDEFEIISRILPAKDVDGLTPQSSGLLSAGRAALVPCTPMGVMRMLEHHGVQLEGRDVVVINRSALIGRPLHHLLLERNATVTTCHSRSRNLADHTRRADVVITAVGDRARFRLTPDMISEGAVVIDVAITRHEGRLMGDTDYEEIIQKASLATPVPGGVGPMTIAMLLKNTVTAASLASN